MKNLLAKEMKLAASPLSYIFILFALMTMIPGYPILVGAFFVCFGIFHSFQSSRENNDILYTVLLPVKKTDAVKAKYAFTCFIQIVSFLLALLLTFVRMTVLSEASPYVNNPMMNANQFYLAGMLIVFAAFNIIFINKFFKTAYKIGIPFLTYGIAAFVLIAISETLHHIPGLEWLNATATASNITMWIFVAVSFVIYIAATLIGLKSSIKKFNEVDI